MSNPLQDNDAAIVISAYRSLKTESWLLTASSVLYCYEWLITLSQEIEQIWDKPLSFTTAIFAVNRYAMLFVMILELIPVTTHLVRNLSLSIYRMADEQLCKSCVWITHLVHGFLLLQHLSSALFTGWRVYAMSSQNQWLACFALVGSAVPVFTNTAIYIKEIPIILTSLPGYDTCQAYNPISLDIVFRHCRWLLESQLLWQMW
ncbi:hypothetical protein BC629DRAFT_795556 [Irpex lacteus]|nr:hypothetical protein BC629DRAFT_795556 [Irpex lacteus]